jgi:hypothetical protein
LAVFDLKSCIWFLSFYIYRRFHLLVFIICFPTYMEPDCWGTTCNNSPHFWGSHPWLTIFQTENGFHLTCICHFLPVSCSKSSHQAILHAKMQAGTRKTVDSFFAKYKLIMI